MALKNDQTGMSLNAYQAAVIYSPGQRFTQRRFDKQGRDAMPMPNAVWRMDRGGGSGADTAGVKGRVAVVQGSGVGPASASTPLGPHQVNSCLWACFLTRERRKPSSMSSKDSLPALRNKTT